MDYESKINRSGLSPDLKEGGGFNLITIGKDKIIFDNVVAASRSIGRERLWASAKILTGGGFVIYGALTDIFSYFSNTPDWQVAAANFVIIIGGWYTIKDASRDFSLASSRDQALVDQTFVGSTDGIEGQLQESELINQPLSESPLPTQG